MEKHLLLILIIATTCFSYSQSISVASFRLLDTDMTANLQGTMRTDQNGHTAALIKVVTTETGYSFDVGVMGVVDTKQEPGEVWVYVPFGVKKITIRHPQLGVLRDYYFPCSIEEARTYEMQLTTGEVQTIIKKDAGGSYFVMTINPKTAIVYIDDELRTNNNGEVSIFLPYGKHTYRVEAASFITDAGIIETGKERKEMSVTLASAQAKLTVSCPDKEASIFINNAEKGHGLWTGNLDAGMYVVEARKTSHRTESQTISLAKQEQKVLTLNAPQPIYGDLNLQSSPANCDVYIDGKLVGKSPDYFSDILIGSHQFKLKRDGYEPASEQITTREGETTEISFTLVEKAQINPAPSSKSSTENYDNQSLTFTISDVTFRMLPVAGGTFTMGANPRDDNADNDERPTHSVTISDFYLGETEVTQALWQAVMGTTIQQQRDKANTSWPMRGVGNDYPMYYITWNDCQEFITKLNTMLSSQLGGKRFALPTEAEWEYAARGGQKNKSYIFSGSNNIENVAWYDDNSKIKSHPVAQKQANELGLYDMSGNVWEWCADWYKNDYYSNSAQYDPTGPTSGSHRVLRGGSWRYHTGYCRVSSRISNHPDYRSYNLGLRLLLR